MDENLGYKVSTASDEKTEKQKGSKKGAKTIHGSTSKQVHLQISPGLRIYHCP